VRYSRTEAAKRPGGGDALSRWLSLLHALAQASLAQGVEKNFTRAKMTPAAAISVPTIQAKREVRLLRSFAKCGPRQESHKSTRKIAFCDTMAACVV
jgi:hypothetical protein